MFSRFWQRQRQRQIQSITEYYRVLQSVTVCYRVLQSISSASTGTNFWACLIYKYCNALKGQEMDSDQSGTVWGNHLGSISGVIDPFKGLWTAAKLNSGHSIADLNLPCPLCQTSQTFPKWLWHGEVVFVATTVRILFLTPSLKYCV